jgi:signal transduction histidine kinase
MTKAKRGLPPQQALNLWPVKHSRARNVSVHFSGSEGGLALSIVDDGIGFDVDAVAAGLGLISVRGRLEPFGGSLTIQSKPGAGARFDFYVPFALKPVIPAPAVAV